MQKNNLGGEPKTKSNLSEEDIGVDKNQYLRGFSKRYHSEKTKEKIRLAALAQHYEKHFLNKLGWSKGLTKETDNRIAFRSKKMRTTVQKKWNDKKYEDIYGEKRTKEIKEKQSLNSPLKKLFVRQKISHTRMTKYSPEQRKEWGLNAAKKSKKKKTSIEIKLEDGLIKNQIPYESQFLVSKVCVIDIVPKNNRNKIAIFADGDYWHNRLNVKEKDERVNKSLQNLGWKILRFWEHDINNNLEYCISKIKEEL